MQLGLIGRSLSHSFSRQYFQQKFEREELEGYSYSNFELAAITDFPGLLDQQPGLEGLNVTIPYKEAILPYLDSISPEAREIGAVNTIRIREGRLEGFNTDAYGFRESLKPLLKASMKEALVLGSGGASRAVVYALRQLGVKPLGVSRHPSVKQIDYGQASGLLHRVKLVINTTPVGTFPEIHEMPPLSLSRVLENYLFYDLIYNPGESRFLREAKQRGASIKNGHEMLILQAERAWAIWHNSKN